MFKMRMIFISKKGVSPIIATVLLIAFAVSLGSVIMTWGLNFRNIKSGDDCSRVSIAINSLDGNDVCLFEAGAAGYMNFAMANRGDIDIGGIVVWVVGQKEAKFFDIDTDTKKGESFSTSERQISYNPSELGPVLQVQFIPKIKHGQASEICPFKSVKSDRIRIC